MIDDPRTGIELRGEDDLLTISEVAIELRCSKAHVYNAINGKISGVSRLPAIPMGRRKLVRWGSLQQWKGTNERGRIGNDVAAGDRGAVDARHTSASGGAAARVDVLGPRSQRRRPPRSGRDAVFGRSGVTLCYVRSLAALIVLTAAAAAPQYSGEMIFPPEKWHNHSSSVVELPNGDLLVCWYHGSGERTADDVLIQGARWNHLTRKWTAPFLMADTPGFPDTNPVLFLDSRRRLFFLWPVIIAHQWETALMKYRISTDYQQEDAPPDWEFQDNIILIPRNIVARTRDFAGQAAAGTGPSRNVPSG